MFDTILSFTLTEHLARAAIPGETAGYSRLLTLNRGPHKTRDGWIAMMPYTDRNWRALYEATGHEDLLDAPWHEGGMRTRLVEADTVYGELKAIIAERTTDEWLAICRAHDVPCEIVPRIAEIVDDPKLHRGVLREAEHPAVGTYRQISPALIFSRTPLAEIADPAPLLGADTAEVLVWLGYDDAAIAEIRGDV
jgi:formyl-CoA transferase